MGNQTSKSGGASGVESLVGELPGVVYKRPLGGGRFFKTSQCVHDEGGPVVVKTYIKRSGSDDVRKYEEALLQVQSKLRGETRCCHVWVVQKVYQSEDAVHIVRQYMWSSLAERITTRPFLNGGDKRWIGYQILLGVSEIHGSGICHGDIKTENVLLTSWGWVFLVDFAPYKPVQLPMDNPADFSFFFDTNGRRKCCLAPERFVQGRHLVGASAVSGNSAAGMMHVDAGSKGKKQPTGGSDDELTMEMDIFAAGCVLAELFSDGKSVLDYSELLVYKRTGQLPKGFYENIRESAMEKLVEWMMEIDPSKRPTGEECLDYYSKNVLKCSPFDTHVHPIVEKILYEMPENRAEVLLKEIGTVWGQGDQNTIPKLYSDSAKYEYAGKNDSNNSKRENDGGTVLQASKGVYELDQVEDFGRELVQQARAAVTGSNINNNNDRIMNGDSDILLVANDREEGNDESNTVSMTRGSQSSLAQESDGHKMQDVYDVLITVQCALIRGCEQNRAKAELFHHVETCLKLSNNAGIVMNHVVPHFVAAASDAHSGFRPKSVALSALPRLLDLAESIPACNARLYADYVFPSISLLPNDVDVGIQVTYSHTVGMLGVQAYTNAASQNQTRGQVPLARSIDKETARIRHWIGRGVHDVLVGTSPAPKLALLPQLQDISFGLGRKDTAEELLPALLTLFNSREWDVRSGLYLALKSITPVLGPKTAPFVLPFLDRMLDDAEPMSVVSSLELLQCLVASNLLQQQEILLVVQKVVASNVHTRPCTAIRIIFAVFLSSASSKLGPMVTEAILCPLVSSCFQQGPSRLTDPVDVVRKLVKTEKRLQSEEKNEIKRFHADYSAKSLDSYLFFLSGGFDGSWRYTKSKLSNVIFSARSARDRVLKHEKREERTISEVLLKFSKQKSKKKATDTKDSAGTDTETVGGKLHEWKPQGILVSRIPCHSRSISKVASLEKSTLFVTASLDGTMKLWDTKRMERDVSFKSRATYCMAEKLEFTSVTALRHQASTFIGGNCSGSLHAWDASTNKLGSTWDLGPGRILDVQSLSAGPNLLLAASQSKGIVGVDVRCPDPLWQLETKSSLGIPFRLGLDQSSSSFIVAGTNRGYLTLWDLRFGLPVNSWMHPSGAPVECVAIASPSLVGNSRSPLVFCAAGEDEISAWDPTSGTCNLVMSQRADVSETCPPFSLCHSLIDPTKPAMDPLGMARQLGAAELRSLSSKRTGIKSFLLEPSGGVISGGKDRVIRYWKNSSESYAIAFAHPNDASSPRCKSTSYAMKRIKGVNVLVERKKMAPEQETSLGHASTELVCHQQPITSLAQVCGQNDLLLVSASADGVINVWR